MNFTPIHLSLVLFSCLAGPRIGWTCHEFEDGFVERSIAIIVRDRMVHVEYSIGLNEATARSVVSDWEQSVLKIGIQEDKVVTNAKKSPTRPTKTDSAQSTQSAKSAASTSNIPGSKNEVAANEESGHAISPELMKRLKRLAPDAIGRGMQIQCDGELVEIAQSSSGPPSRHPFTLSVAFQFELPESRSCELEMVDRNFGSRSGAYKHAAKTKGRAMIMQSNVAPILVRAERIEIKDDPEDLHPTIKLGLGFVPKSTR